MTMAAEEERSEAAASVAAKEIFYKTKLVQFLGRATRIVLQNDNGPCPLLAICNVLLLKNSLGLSSDVSEVSLQQLLSLVAERLIDSNSNVQDKDDGYVNNQQQNISDAIDLLPRLATGIDVNVQFRKINDFEFTRECAVFDLLDIGLYHGWIVDPQDTDAAAAIGSKSYNTIVAELVQAFEASKSNGGNSSEEVEDCVDFAAATATSLGVSSPSLSRDRLFDDQVSVAFEKRRGKGDIEEEEELMRVLNLSKVEVLIPGSVSMPADVDQRNSSVSLDENELVQRSALGTHVDVSSNQNGELSDKFESQECHATTNYKDDVLAEECKNDLMTSENVRTICEKSTKSEENVRTGTVTNEEGDSDSCSNHNDLMTAENGESIMKTCSQNVSTYQIHEDYTAGLVTASRCNLQSSNGEEPSNVSEGVSPSLQGNEPIYEGVESILKSGLPIGMNPEPVYEGETVLAEQAEKMEENEFPAHMKDKDAYEQWHVIKSFLEHNASQLTIYGLFCLQEGLKERELCVFFRNNHFSTMFKFKGELYLLATDQGYMNQSDLVWEKLNEVNGDTVFMTGNFTEFKPDNQVHDSWNEQSSVTSTTDYLAEIGSSGHPNSTFDSDLQLAMALHQHELEQESQQQSQRQQQQQQQQRPQQPSPGRSRLITGPRVSSSRSGVPRRNESKRKEKCVVM